MPSHTYAPSHGGLQFGITRKKSTDGPLGSGLPSLRECLQRVALPLAAQHPELPLSAHKQPSLPRFSIEQTKKFIDHGAGDRRKTATTGRSLSSCWLRHALKWSGSERLEAYVKLMDF
jgi:hypothetical protein